MDDLIAANPAVLNLETSVPASDFEDIGRVAPRMSLVVVQRAGYGPPSIGFWQVLSASNPDLRAWHDDPPEVLEQIAQCARWMAEDHRKAEVVRAYRNTAASLLALYRLFRAGDRSERKSARIWQELARAEAPVVIVQPGLVIGNYWPEGYREPVASGRMAQHAARFAGSGTRDKLTRTGIRIHEVGPDHGGPALPFLQTSLRSSAR